MSKLNYYQYAGPVTVFGKCVANMWLGSTYAASEKKAKSNLSYQFKQQNNLLPCAKVELPGNISTG